MRNEMEECRTCGTFFVEILNVYRVHCRDDWVLFLCTRRDIKWDAIRNRNVASKCEKGRRTTKISMMRSSSHTTHTKRTRALIEIHDVNCIHLHTKAIGRIKESQDPDSLAASSRHIGIAHISTKRLSGIRKRKMR